MLDKKVLLVVSLVLVHGNGFLRDPSSSQTPSVSKTDHALVDVLDFLAEEKALRRQLEQVVLQMKQDISELKQHNATGLMEEMTQLNKTMTNLHLENQALKDEITNLTQQDVKRQRDNEALIQEVANLTQQNMEMKLEYQALKLDNYDLKQEIANLKQQDLFLGSVANMSDKDKQSWLTETITLVNQTVSNLEVKIQALNLESVNLTERVKYTSELITNMPGSTDKPEIGFTVRFESDTRVNGNLKFTHIISNFGNMYDQTTGRFTCKRSGLYLFLFKALSTTANPANIVKNNSLLALVYTSNQSNNYYSGSTSVLVHLEVYDQIWVKSDQSVYFNYPSYFTGVLIA